MLVSVVAAGPHAHRPLAQPHTAPTPTPQILVGSRVVGVVVGVVAVGVGVAAGVGVVGVVGVVGCVDESV